MPKDQDLWTTTLDPAAPTPLPTDGPVLTLTILHHPDARRVGERSVVAGAVALSRLSPGFVRPGGGRPTPLADPCLSRRGVLVEPGPRDRVQLIPDPTGAPLVVDGTAAPGPVQLTGERITAGAVLELGGRVVLLLHRARPIGDQTADCGLVGASDSVHAMRREIARVADLDVSVLLRGESGTGKELLARAIHAASPRRGGPFVAVNMAALAPATAASALFGHVKGAFTGADRAHRGLFQQADGGTLLLDEIGEASEELQTMLLRAIETGEVTPMGAHVPVPVSVRLVAATDADLEGMVADGRFREPLLHRLAGYPIVLPPLRERRDDIGRLLYAFLRAELSALGEETRLEQPASERKPWLPASLVASLARHDWPGNVRELRNVARQIAIASRGEARVRFTFEPTRAKAAPAPPASSAPLDETRVLDALRRSRWQPAAAAAALGVSRTTLYAYMERSPRIRKASDLSREELAVAIDACGGDLEAMVERLEVSRRALQLRLRELGLTLP